MQQELYDLRSLFYKDCNKRRYAKPSVICPAIGSEAEISFSRTARTFAPGRLKIRFGRKVSRSSKLQIIEKAAFSVHSPDSNRSLVLDIVAYKEKVET